MHSGVNGVYKFAFVTLRWNDLLSCGHPNSFINMFYYSFQTSFFYKLNKNLHHLPLAADSKSLCAFRRCRSAPSRQGDNLLEKALSNCWAVDVIGTMIALATSEFTQQHSPWSMVTFTQAVCNLRHWTKITGALEAVRVAGAPRT